MIRVSLDMLIVIYLTILLGVLFCVWMTSAFISSRRESRRRRSFIICNICDHIYEDHSEKQIVHCPACHAKNERERVQEI